MFFGYNQYWPDGFMVFMSRSTHPVSTINRPASEIHPNGASLLRQTDSVTRLDDGWAKAQPAVVLILKHLRKRRHGFKSHLTDWKKPGIPHPPTPPPPPPPPPTSALQGIGWPCSLAVPVLAGWVYVFFVFLCPGAP